MLDSNQVQPVISSVVTPVALEGFKTPLLNKYPGAAAAYSLRRLKSWDDGKRVVEVRRSSDSTTQDFSASQITGGQMLDWVNTDPAPYSSDFSVDTDGFFATRAVVTGNVDGISGVEDTLRFVPNSGSNTTTFTRKNGVFTGGQKSTISFDYYFPSTNSTFTGFAVLDGTSGGSTELGAERSATTDAWTTVTFTDVEPTQSNLQIFAADADQTVSPNGTDLIYFKNFTITQTTADGFVSTWYDQSGNANNATQATTTSQPKIVDAGVLVAGGIDFDGVDDFLNISTPTVLGVEFYEVMVSKPVSASSQTNAAFISPNAAGGGERSYINTSTNNLSIRNNSTNIPSTLSPNQTAQQLIAFSSTAADFTFVLDGADDVKLALISPMIAGTIAGGAGSLAGTFSEVILYASDQSANRVGIETNINDFYSIY